MACWIGGRAQAAFKTPQIFYQVALNIFKFGEHYGRFAIFGGYPHFFRRQLGVDTWLRTAYGGLT
jgi:hypothetical protein